MGEIRGDVREAKEAGVLKSNSSDQSQSHYVCK